MVNNISNLIIRTTVLFLISYSSQAAPILFIHDNSGKLARVDIATNVVELIGEMVLPIISPTPLVIRMTDIAFDSNGTLYGIDRNDLYTIDITNTGASGGKYVDVKRRGRHSILLGNALVFDANDTLYGAGAGTEDLFVLDIATGSSKRKAGIGYRSAGDLAFYDGDKDGEPELYMSSTTNELVHVDLDKDPASGAVGTSRGALGYQYVYGLAAASNDVLYGVAGTSVFSIDASTGKGTFTLDYTGQDLGSSNGSSFFLGAPGFTSKAVEPDLTCPPSDGQPKDNLIVVIHGWNAGTIDPDTGEELWPLEFVDNIKTRQSYADISENWDVCAYDWSKGAQTGKFFNRYVIPIEGNAFLAWQNARKYGHSLGHRLYCSGYDHIHFIAHSAGSNLAQTAVQYIEDVYASSHNDCTFPKPTYHMTFMDAFDPGRLNARYGEHALWAEHFLDDRGPRQTDGKLKFTYNIDISALDPDQDNPVVDSPEQSSRHHAWPYEWYLCTTQVSLYPPPDWGACGGFLQYGFFRALGHGTNDVLPSHDFTDIGKRFFPRGKCVELNLGEERVCGSTQDPQTQTKPEGIYISTPPTTIESVAGTIDGPSFQVSDLFPSISDPLPHIELASGAPAPLKLQSVSPAWVSVLFETAEKVNSIDFQYLFEETAKGILTVHFDGEEVFATEEAYSFKGINHSHPVWLGETSAGLHMLTFRLDALSDKQSKVVINNVSVGNYSVTDLPVDADPNPTPVDIQGSGTGNEVLSIKGCGKDRATEMYAIVLGADGDWRMDSASGSYSGKYQGAIADGKLRLSLNRKPKAKLYKYIGRRGKSFCNTKKRIRSPGIKRFVVKIDSRNNTLKLLLNIRYKARDGTSKRKGTYGVLVKASF